MSKSKKKKNGKKNVSRYSGKTPKPVNTPEYDESVYKKKKKSVGAIIGSIIKKILIWALLLATLIGMGSWIFAMF